MHYIHQQDLACRLFLGTVYSELQREELNRLKIAAVTDAEIKAERRRRSKLIVRPGMESPLQLYRRDIPGYKLALATLDAQDKGESLQAIETMRNRLLPSANSAVVSDPTLYFTNRDAYKQELEKKAHQTFAQWKAQVAAAENAIPDDTLRQSIASQKTWQKLDRIIDNHGDQRPYYEKRLSEAKIIVSDLMLQRCRLSFAANQ
jgi:hypothetical protein